MTPFVMVIFGATGDLALHKLIPSFFALYKENLLPQDFFIIGFSRRDFKLEEFHEYFKDQESDPKWQDFATHLLYQSGSFEDENGYKALNREFLQIDKKMGACVTRFFYL